MAQQERFDQEFDDAKKTASDDKTIFLTLINGKYYFYPFASCEYTVHNIICRQRSLVGMSFYQTSEDFDACGNLPPKPLSAVGTARDATDVLCVNYTCRMYEMLLFKNILQH